MKRCFFILLISSYMLLTYETNAQYFEWARKAGSIAFDLGFGIATDNSGNVFVAGKYEYNANFNGTYVSCAGNHDIFVAKYTPSGGLLWVKTAGGIAGDYAHAVCTDAAGNVYITGEIEQTVRFGSVTVKGHGAHNDVFIAKYNPAGILLWVKSFGGYSNDQGLGISADASGNVYITGQFQGVNYINSTTLVSSGGMDIFIAKYTTNGDFQWVRKAGGGGADEGWGIKADNSGNTYVTGYFSGTAKFGSTSITSSGGDDIFIAKYSTDGILQWVKKAGGGANDQGKAITIDNSGKVFITGGCRLYSVFGSLSVKISGGNAGVFVACYNSEGKIQWVRKADGYMNDSGRGICVDALSNIYITGQFGKTAQFGTTTLTGVDTSEIFFASYTSSGVFRWALNAKGSVDVPDDNRYHETGLAIAVDKSGNVYGSGMFRSNTVFNRATLVNYNKHTDIFVTKIAQSSMQTSTSTPVPTTLTATITASGPTTFCSGGSVVLNANTRQGYIYQWKKNGVAIIGAYNSSYVAKTSGDYQIRIISGASVAWSAPERVIVNNCKTEDSLFFQQVSEDAILNVSNSVDPLQLKVYPNPTNGLFSIEIINMNNFSEENISIEVVNETGQLVYSSEPKKVSGQMKKTIELDKTLPSGIYFLKIKIGDKEENTKLMLAR